MSEIPPAFEALFWKCLDEIPLEDAEIVKAYWTNWDVQPIFGVEKLTFGVSPFRGNAGSVGPISEIKQVLAHFKFHYVIVNLAPENIKRAVIKHELAHCYLMGTHENYKTEAALEKWREGDRHISRLQGERPALGRVPYLDREENEQRAIMKNLAWKSDEKSIDLWFESFGRRA